MRGWSPFALREVFVDFWRFSSSSTVARAVWRYQIRNVALFALPPTGGGAILVCAVPVTSLQTVGLVIIGLLALFATLFFQQSFSIGDRIERARSDTKQNADFVSTLERLLGIANYASMVCVIGVSIDIIPIFAIGTLAKIGLFLAGWLVVHMVMLALMQISYMHRLSVVALRGVARE